MAVLDAMLLYHHAPSGPRDSGVKKRRKIVSHSSPWQDYGYRTVFVVLLDRRMDCASPSNGTASSLQSWLDGSVNYRKVLTLAQLKQLDCLH